MEDLNWEDGEDVTWDQGEDVTWESTDASPADKSIEGLGGKKIDLSGLGGKEITPEVSTEATTKPATEERSYLGIGTIRKNPTTGKWEVGEVESGERLDVSDIGDPLGDLAKAATAGGVMLKSALPFGKHIAAGAESLTSGRPFEEALAAQREEAAAYQPANVAGAFLQGIPLAGIGAGGSVAGQLTGAGLGSGLASTLAETSSGKENMDLPGAFREGVTEPLAYLGPLVGPAAAAVKAGVQGSRSLVQKGINLLPGSKTRPFAGEEGAALRESLSTVEDPAKALKQVRTEAAAGEQAAKSAIRTGEKRIAQDVSQRVSGLEDVVSQAEKKIEGIKQAAQRENLAIKDELTSLRKLSGEQARRQLTDIQARVKQNVRDLGEARSLYLNTAEEMRTPLPEWQERLVSLRGRVEDLLRSGGLTDTQLGAVHSAVDSVSRRLNTLPGQPLPTKGDYVKEVLALRKTLGERIPWESADPKAKSQTLKEIRSIVGDEVKSPDIDTLGKLREFDNELNKNLTSKTMLKTFGRQKDVPVTFESGARGVQKETVFSAPTKAMRPPEESMLSALVDSGVITTDQANDLRRQYGIAGKEIVPEPIQKRQERAVSTAPVEKQRSIIEEAKARIRAAEPTSLTEKRDVLARINPEEASKFTRANAAQAEIDRMKIDNPNLPPHEKARVYRKYFPEVNLGSPSEVAAIDLMDRYGADVAKLAESGSLDKLPPPLRSIVTYLPNRALSAAAGGFVGGLPGAAFGAAASKVSEPFIDPLQSLWKQAKLEAASKQASGDLMRQIQNPNTGEVLEVPARFAVLYEALSRRARQGE